MISSNPLWGDPGKSDAVPCPNVNENYISPVYQWNRVGISLYTVNEWNQDSFSSFSPEKDHLSPSHFPSILTVPACPQTISNC